MHRTDSRNRFRARKNFANRYWRKKEFSSVPLKRFGKRVLDLKKKFRVILVIILPFYSYYHLSINIY